MSYYRAYMIGSDGHFTKSVDLSCDKDEAAREKASSSMATTSSYGSGRAKSRYKRHPK
jgi:hypothetical protein